MRALVPRLRNELIDLVVASPLRRSWSSAWIVARGLPVRLEPDFREIHFGRWEGLTAEEIRAADPLLYEDWQARKPGFEYPNGEPREEFRARVERGLERLLSSDARGALLVVHKGVIRTVVELLSQETPDPAHPALGQVLGLSRDGESSWYVGRRSSDPPGLADLAAS
jgi:broad specificity phosphatase PhoE